MKKLTWMLLFFTIAAVCLVIGCGTKSAAPGQEFTLNVKEKISIRGEDLTVEFAGIEEDSRCPTGAVYASEGQVKCNVLLTKNGTVNPLIFTQPGASPGTASSLGYAFAFRVEPYPELGHQIAPNDYRLIMKVSVP